MNIIRRLTTFRLFAMVVSIFPVVCLPTSLAIGQSAGSTQGLPTDTTALQTAVEAYPDSLEIHEQYISQYLGAMKQSIAHPTNKAYDSVLLLLIPQYQSWMKQFPRCAAVPLAIGEAYVEAELPQARQYLLKAVALNPNLAKAWMDLWIDADRWGGLEAGRDYLKKAMEADPTNPDYAFYYANSFDPGNPVKYHKLSLDLVRNFPNSSRSAQALYWLASRSTDQKDKIAFYEQLRNKFPPAKFNWSESGMSEYFDFLLQSDPSKALNLARSMSKLKLSEGDKKEWDRQIVMAQKIIKALRFLREDKMSETISVPALETPSPEISQLSRRNKPAEAVKILAGVRLNPWSDAREFLNLLEAKAADASGNTADAYDSVLVFFAKTPGDKSWETLERYGTRLGKSAAQIKADVWKQRDVTARPAPPFRLAAYLTHDSVSLSDYRGKVLLLTFWFPGCGPCRGEFPHFQKVLNEFKGKDIAYVGINVLPEQDEYVVPFMKSSSYSFTPLHGNSDWAENVYKVRGEPTNFLIDPRGRIIFSGFMIGDAKKERMLQLMISSLLSHNGDR